VAHLATDQDRRLEACWMTLSPVMDGTLFRQELFRMLVENSSDIVVQVDDRFRRIYTSPSYQEVLGYTEDEVLGQDAMEL
jgi:PAS domain-containing protein